MDKIDGKKPQRVVYLLGELTMGGSERQLALLLRAMDRTAWQPWIVVFHPSPQAVLENELRRMEIPLVFVPPEVRGAPWRLWYLARLFRQIRPQVVHSWMVHYNPYAGLAGWLAGVPVRWGSLRGSLRLEDFRRLPALLRWLSLHGVQRIVTNAEALRKELVEAGVAPEQVFVLPNCVEAAQNNMGQPDLSAWGIGPTDRLVGIVGNLRRVKNHALFIDAMKQVLPAHPEVKALIVGEATLADPDLPGEMEGQIRTAGLEGKVILTGFRPDAPTLMQRMEVVCLTSTNEGAPNVLLEAMAAGRPVVATRVGGVGDVVQDGQTGFLVEPGNAAGLAERVAQLLTDPELADRMGEAGRDLVLKTRGCPQGVEQLTARYERVLSTAKGQ